MLDGKCQSKMCIFTSVSSDDNCKRLLTIPVAPLITGMTKHFMNSEGL
jgi:hypothetical protein